MQRRPFLLALGSLALMPASVRAHHGWSGFDQSRPLYLAGLAQDIAWANPHVEFSLRRAAGLSLPADLRKRTLPAQTSPVDGPALLAAAQLPERQDPLWRIELAPLSRMEAWQVPTLQAGEPVAVLGYAGPEEDGLPVMRAEYLFLGARSFGLRSSPA
ncbi:DUF6152 family protein [Niveibacterium sp. SC-1]|uniref:DUF6152 family protein n=1 Tax=Niveibacterium sp. SC-1 TaxID=3135646 RepID=UPI00311DA607